MRRIIGVTAASIGILALGSAPAWASGPIDTGQGVAVTITNPAAATVTLGTNALSMDATVNTDGAHEAPSNMDTSGQIGTGGIFVRVQSNNGNGYALEIAGPAAGFTSPGQTAMPNNDFHLTSLSVNGNGGPVFNTNTLATPLTVLTNNGVSGSVWDDNLPPGNDPGRVAGQDETRIAAFINPNVLIGGKTYTGTIEALYVPTP